MRTNKSISHVHLLCVMMTQCYVNVTFPTGVMSTHNICTEDITLSVFSLFSLMGPLSLCSFHDARCHSRVVSPTMMIVFHAQGSGI